MSPAAKWEYMKTVYPRYRQANRSEKKRILDEFCKSYDCHRKHAIRLLNGPIPSPQRPRRRGRRTYKDDVLSILQAVWKAAGYPWSARLKALLPVWLPWIQKRYRLRPEQERQLLAISPAQIDRRLAPVKQRLRKRIYGGTKPGSLLKHHIPIKTDCWDVDRPGFTEIDTVSHSGDNASGLFAYTLDVTDIHTTWTECVTILGKNQTTICQAMDVVEEARPFKLLGIDSDNGSEFINDLLWRWAQTRTLQFTRGRPYKKDDNAHVEQKNFTHVRKHFGYVRYDSPEAVDAMNAFNRHTLRLFQNFFQPSVKLLKKIRIGSKLKRVYDAPKTPWQRVLACPQADPLKIAALQALFETLDPFDLAQRMDQQLAAIYRLSSTLKRQGSRPFPKLLPASVRKAREEFRADRAGLPRGIPTTTIFQTLADQKDNPVWKFRKLYAKEKFRLAS